MEIQTEALKSQTTEALKALLDYSITHKNHFKSELDKVYFPSQNSQFKGALEIYENYSEIVRTLEDELGRRLEDIFIF